MFLQPLTLTLSLLTPHLVHLLAEFPDPVLHMPNAGEDLSELPLSIRLKPVIKLTVLVSDLPL